MGEWTRACTEGDLADGTMLRFDHGDKKILLARRGEKIFATDVICTHEEADLSTGFLSEQGVTCPLHLSVFNLDSGVPQNPPAEESVATYNVKIDAGAIYVEI